MTNEVRNGSTSGNFIFMQLLVWSTNHILFRFKPIALAVGLARQFRSGRINDNYHALKQTSADLVGNGGTTLLERDALDKFRATWQNIKIFF
jgi:hypothetical protein